MRAVIAEDSVLLRVGLIKVLEMGAFQVAAEADDAEGMLAAVAEHRPELALIDVRMPHDSYRTNDESPTQVTRPDPASRTWARSVVDWQWSGRRAHDA